MKKFNNKQNELVTKETIGDREMWISRAIAVVGIIIVKINNDYFTLTNKRGKGAADNKGKYNACCGYLDWDETAPEACQREVFEETGINIDNILKKEKILIDLTKTPFFVNSQPNENKQNVSLTYCLFFESNVLPETTTKYSEPDEVEKVKWINIKEINKYDFAFDHEIRIMSFFNSFHVN